GQHPGTLPGQRGLQQVEVLARAAAGDQLAVQRRAAQAQRLDGVADLRDAVGPFQRVARPQPHLAVAHRGQDPVAVPLDLVQPLLPFRGVLAQPRQLRLERALRRFGRARAGQGQGALLPALVPGARRWHFRQALAGGLAAAGAPAVLLRRRRDLGQQVVGLQAPGPGVLVLEQQPLRLPCRLAGAHQVPTPLELAAVQLEAQVALGQLLLGIALGGPHAMVKARHVAAAVLTLGNLALEAGVVQRMVLDLHRHALDRRIVAGPLGHGPALEGVAHLQAEVVMAAAGVVQLDHEDRPLPARRRLAGLRLAGAVEAALALVVDQAHARPSAPQMAAHRVGRGPDRGHGLAQLLLAHAERLGPVTDLVVLGEVDTVAVGRADLLGVVGHGGGFPGFGAPTLRLLPSRPRESGARRPELVSVGPAPAFAAVATYAPARAR